MAIPNGYTYTKWFTYAKHILNAYIYTKHILNAYIYIY